MTFLHIDSGISVWDWLKLTNEVKFFLLLRVFQFDRSEWTSWNLFPIVNYNRRRQEEKPNENKNKIKCCDDEIECEHRQNGVKLLLVRRSKTKSYLFDRISLFYTRIDFDWFSVFSHKIQ